MPRWVPAGAGRPPRKAGRSGFPCTRRPRARLRRRRRRRRQRGRPRRLSVLRPSQPPSRLADLPSSPHPSSRLPLPRARADGGGRDERERPPPSRLRGFVRVVLWQFFLCFASKTKEGFGKILDSSG